jgi:hypothetical protein
MHRSCFPLGLLLLGAAIGGGANGRSAEPPAPFREDQAKLQGTWKPVKLGTPLPDAECLYLQFDKGLLVVTHAVGGERVITKGIESVEFALQGRGKGRVIGPWAIPYRFADDRLIIEGGEVEFFDLVRQTGDSYTVPLKGEWQRLGGDLARLQGSWEPARRPKDDLRSLQFVGALLHVGGTSPGKDGKPDFGVETVFVELQGTRNKQLVLPVPESKHVSPIVYRFVGSSLIIEAGEFGRYGKVSLRGEWQRHVEDRRPVP